MRNIQLPNNVQKCKLEILNTFGEQKASYQRLCSDLHHLSPPVLEDQTT